MSKKNKVKKPLSDKSFNVILIIITAVILVAVLYPIIYVFSSSFSSGAAVATGQVWLWPVDFSIFGYKWVFSNKIVWTGYLNSVGYTLSASVLTVIMTICGAYPLSRKNYQAKGFIEKFAPPVLIDEIQYVPELLNYIKIVMIKMVIQKQKKS